MRWRWVVLPALLVVAVGLGAGVWMLSRRVVLTEPPKDAGPRLFEQVFNKVKSSAVDPVSEQELYRRAAAGVIDELDDPYAILLLPGEPAPPLEGTPVPPGLYLDRRDGLVVILATVPGSAADSAGVQSGDRLIGVDSTIADATRIDRLMAALAGPTGTSVTLRLRRSGVRGPLNLVVTRRALPTLPLLEASLLSGGVARIRVRQPLPGIADSIRRALEALRSQGAKSLVLDLRSAVGGALEDGVAMADLFLPQGAMIAMSRGRPSGATARFTDHAPSPFEGMPLAVLIDAGTAGAAEIVAGALQDHDRAAILGSRSFGHGVTESTFRLGAGGSLSLTTSLWITPSGRQIQHPPRSASGDSLPVPKLKSDAGRVLVGGGGIVPDREIAETNHGDFALAEARRILEHAGSQAEVLAMLGSKP
jgi:carboxyl-terminal processing protease